MLKSIDPLLDADLLHALRSMGHGDEIVICDTNFPSTSVARETVLGRPLSMNGADAGRATTALLSVLPLDSFVDDRCWRMEVVGDPQAWLPVHGEVQSVIDRLEERPSQLRSLDRFAFYERAKACFALVATGERRFYGNFIFKKGVVPPPD